MREGLNGNSLERVVRRNILEDLWGSKRRSVLKKIKKRGSARGVIYRKKEKLRTSSKPSNQILGV